MREKTGNRISMGALSCLWIEPSIQECKALADFCNSQASGTAEMQDKVTLKLAKVDLASWFRREALARSTALKDPGVARCSHLSSADWVRR